MNIRGKLSGLLRQLNTVIVGKAEQVNQSVVCLLAGGHLLIEDVPGVGKTTLAQALARSFGLDFARVQFTSDLMPSDLSGVSIYDRHRESFSFHPGPIFTQVLLADEVNRASPKTQSALLEAMAEHQVSSDGQTRPLPEPFFVIATQNPLEQLGTYPLPESQLDRFLMRISLGYPGRDAEKQLLTQGSRHPLAAKLPPALLPGDLQMLQAAVGEVQATSALLDYLLDLVDTTRNGRWFAQGLSPRASLAILNASRAQALVEGRDFVVPEDVQAVFAACAAHRLTPAAGATLGAREQVRAMMNTVPLR